MERRGVAVVLRLRIGVDIAGQRPAVRTVVRLGPPAVEHAELEPSVQGGLHPARPARFERRPRQVQPQVASTDEPRRDREVVIVEEHDALADDARALESEQPLEYVLGVVVARVGLAGEHDLDGAVATEQRLGPFGVAGQQVEPLVCRHPAGKADRQHVGVEHLRRRLNVLAHVTAGQPVKRRACCG